MTKQDDREALKAAAEILRTCRSEQRICKPDDQREEGSRSTDNTPVEAAEPTVTVLCIVEAHAAFEATICQALAATTEMMFASVTTASLPDKRVGVRCEVTCSPEAAECVRDLVKQSADNAAHHARQVYAGQLPDEQMQVTSTMTIC